MYATSRSLFNVFKERGEPRNIEPSFDCISFKYYSGKISVIKRLWSDVTVCKETGL